MSNLPELTQKELEYYASLNLEDPDDEALQHLTGITAGTATTEAVSLPSSSFPSPTSSSSPLRLNSAAARSRPHGTTTTTSSRCGVTDVLDKTDLVGGIAGMADAALQTRVVELPGRALTTIAAVQCFLNATHLYLQHNALVSLEGLELLQGLRVLVVHHNNVTSAAPLRELEGLFFVDLSYNAIPSLTTLLNEELPCAGLRYLSLQGNPWTGEGRSQDKYVAALRAACPALEYVDSALLANDTDDTDDEDDDDAEHGTSEAPAVAQGGVEKRPSSHRAHSLVKAARAANTARESTSAASPRSPVASPQDPNGEGRPFFADRGASTSAKHATPLEQEEARLVRQLQQYTAQVRPYTAAGEGRADLATADTGEEDAGAPEPGDATDVGDKLQLFQGLQYTQDVTQARQQRELAAHWDDVSRVLQTAQGLQLDRRRRMHERLQSNTDSYAATLQLLQKESYTKDLDRYRGTGVAAAPPAAVAPTAGSLPGTTSSFAAASAPTTRKKSDLSAKPDGAATAGGSRKSSIASEKKSGSAAQLVPKPPPPRR